MKLKFLECGKVINKRGIGGELKVECYCDSPAALKNAKVLYSDKNGTVSHNVVSIKDYKGFLYIKLEDVNSVEAADSMRGKILYADRDVILIDDDRHFIADLIGLEVVDADNNTLYGKIKEVRNYGASDIYVVSDGSKEYMLPAVDGIVVDMDSDNKVYVRPIPGIFDDAEEIR